MNIIKNNIDVKLRNYRGNEIYEKALGYTNGVGLVSINKDMERTTSVKKNNIKYRKEVKVGDEWIDVEEIRSAYRLINKVKRQLGEEGLLLIIEDNKY